MYATGKVGITVDTFWYEPKTNSAEDKKAAELALQMNVGRLHITTDIHYA